MGWVPNIVVALAVAAFSILSMVGAYFIVQDVEVLILPNLGLDLIHLGLSLRQRHEIVRQRISLSALA